MAKLTASKMYTNCKRTQKSVLVRSFTDGFEHTYWVVSIIRTYSLCITDLIIFSLELISPTYNKRANDLLTGHYVCFGALLLF